MLRSLHLKDVGPAARFDLDLGERLNVLTGDNGLGKSFVLDVAWWALTGRWVSKLVLPHKGNEEQAEIGFQLDFGEKRGASFHRATQLWHDPVRDDRDGFDASDDGVAVPAWLNDYPWSLVIYARSEGSFSVWDPARNYAARPSADVRIMKPNPYHFDVQQLWYGLKLDDKMACNGLIRDWATWQLEARDDETHPFHLMARILEVLSHPDERMVPGKSLKVYHDDVLKYPTIDLPYGNVPVIHASEGMKRILGLAYLLTWAWNEHVAESNMLGRDPPKTIVFLIDEIESHLHPKWQRHILPAVLRVLEGLGSGIKPQILVTTHSPLVLASLETEFDAGRDKQFLFELVDQKVTLRELPWAKRGDAVSWLTSDVFGLQQGGSIPADRAIEAAHKLIEGDVADLPEGLRTEEEIDRELRRVLAEQHPFLADWYAWRKYKNRVIRTERAPEPASFDADVRKPGQRWLAEHPKSKSEDFPPYWRKVSEELEAAFEGRCAYTAMALMGPGTVDHFVSLHEDPSQGYEWRNYRYAAAWINSKKSALRSDQILDPCEIGDDWFELILDGCELRVTERCPEALRDRARFMLRRLGLDHGRDAVKYRKKWLELHEKGLLLTELDKLAPLLARAIRKKAAAEPPK